MNKQKSHLTLLTCLITIVFSYAQEETQNDTINTQVVNVVKPYKPTISDAFKVKEIPTLNDSVTAAKKDIKYNIFSIPVASTFTPAKGKAAVVDKAEKEKLYDNYATLGVGTYTTILGEVYLNYALNRTESVGGYFSHHSSQGGIKDLVLDDDFSNTKLRVNYARSLRDMNWTVDAGYQRQGYNWYGLPVDLFAANNVELTKFDVKHIYNAFDVGGKINFEDLFVNNIAVRFNRFSDDLGSGENHFTAKTTIDIPIQDELIKTDFKFDYLGGKFERNYFANNELKYENFQVGLSPSYQLTQDDLTVNLGFSAYYLNDTEASKSKFFIYPNVTASYRLVNDVLIAYGGITGDLQQNTYQDFANENPFVSPTLFIAPTDQQYNGFVGLKGKLSNNMSYNVRGNYYAERAKALFKSNTFSPNPEAAYTYGNSFNVVYDNVNTFSVFGEINVDINRNFNLGLKAEYFKYTTDTQAEAWNLPDIEASIFMDYQINKNWFTGASIFFVGERKAQQAVSYAFTNTTETVNLKGYFDANAHVGYRINERFSAYVKANNIVNQDYNRWLNFPVQGIQLLAGLTYKFDF